MQLNDARTAYDGFTGKASDSARSLAFAGIAVVWVFRVGATSIPPDFILPLLLFSASLGFDLLQYVVAGILWGTFLRHKEQQTDVDETTDFEAPAWINWPGNTLFGLKLLAVFLGYLSLTRQLLSQLVSVPV